MRICPLVVALGLFTIGTWASDHVLAAADLRPEDLARAPGVLVTIGAAAPDAWKVATATVRFATRAGVTGPSGSRASIRGPVSGAAASTFDTDLAPGVTRIVFDPVVFEMDPPTAPRGSLGVPTFHLVPVTVAFTFATASKPMSDWVKAVSARTGPPVAPRDVTVTIKNAQGVAQRTILLLRSSPTEYTSAGSVCTIAIQPASIQVKAASHGSAFEWLTANLMGTVAQRDVKLSFTESGREVSSSLLRQAWLTEFSWSALDKSSSDVVTESITLLPALIDPVP